MKFDKESKCIKCGNEGRKFVDDRDVIVFRMAAHAEYKADLGKILRTCKRCKYMWLEEPLDR